MPELDNAQDRTAQLSEVKRLLLKKRLLGKPIKSSKPAQIYRRADNGFPALSFAQQRLWFLYQLEPDNLAYNIAFYYRLRGRLDVSAFERSLNEIVRRHEALRTTFASVDGEPIQVIASSVELPLSIVELEGLSEAEKESKIYNALIKETRHNFDLTKGPVLRTTLLRAGAREHFFILVVHHIAFDGWSAGIFLRELGKLYTAFSAGKPSPLSELPIQYADFAVWQRQWLQGRVLEDQIAYWKHQLGDDVPVLQLPTDRPRPAVQTYQGATESFVLSEVLKTELKTLSRHHGVTLFMTLLAGFQALLFHYTGQAEFAIGSPIANRNRPEIENLIGFFVNTMVLKCQISGNPSFEELLERVRDITLEAYDHQDLPFERLVEELQPERDMSHSPLFQVMFVLLNVSMEPGDFPDLTMTPLKIASNASMFDISLYMQEREDGLAGTFEYNTDLFDDTTITKMTEHFENLLESVVSEPGQRISELSLMGEAERHQLLVQWNETTAEYPEKKCIHELFEVRAVQIPDQVALISEAQQLTFAELNERANQLAHYLNRMDVGPGALVGLCLERSLAAYAAMLGVLKSGAAYLPLDPAYPRQRLSFMLQDSKATVLLAHGRTRNVLPEFECRVIYLDQDWEVISAESHNNPVGRVKADDAAYVIYTSGSTGEPKGVIGLHGGAVNRFRWMWKNYPFGADEVCCQKTALSFVDSVWESFGPLLQGIPTVIMAEDKVKDPRVLINDLAGHSVSRIVLVPSLLQVMLDTFEDLQDRLPKLHLWITSGETISSDLARKFNQQMPSCKLLNLYGSSEVSADCTFFDVSRGDFEHCVPIGRPIDNTQVYILDAFLKPVPTGVHGELYVGGAGLARGYHNRPEMTVERFVDNPYIPGGRLFRTGDYGRYLADGNIEFLDRMDQQVKIRGYRIELGEIEAALAKHPAINKAVVLARENESGDNQLAAYFVPHDENKIRESHLSKFIQGKLPNYMIPSYFVKMDKLPLTPNAKIDRQAFPAPDKHRPDLSATFVEPRTATENTLADIWKEVLNVKKVGVYDDFFELGGHSLLTIRLVAQIEKLFDQTIPLTTLFQAPTIAQLADILHRDNIEDLWSPLVKIRTGHSKPPLFCVHAAEGNILEYHALAKYLDPDQPVYGIQAAGLKGKKVVSPTIEEIAALFIEQIQTVQSQGPYFLAGYCFGGIVAFEMAQQLYRLKQEIALLALINTPAPGHINKKAAKLTTLEKLSRRMIERAKLESANLSYLQWKDKLVYINNRFMQSKSSCKVKSEKLLDSLFSKLGLKYRWHSRDYILQRSTDQRNAAYMAYKARPLKKQMVLLRVTEQSKLWPADPYLGWKKLIDEDIVDIEICGYHKNILLEPNVRNVAKELQTCLNRVQDT